MNVPTLGRMPAERVRLEQDMPNGNGSQVSKLTRPIELAALIPEGKTCVAISGAKAKQIAAAVQVQRGSVRGVGVKDPSGQQIGVAVLGPDDQDCLAG